MKVLVTWTEKEKFPGALGQPVNPNRYRSSRSKKKKSTESKREQTLFGDPAQVEAPNFTPLAARPPSDRPPSEKDSPGQQPAMSERKAVIKNADMSEDMQQDAIDCATQARIPDARSMT